MKIIKWLPFPVGWKSKIACFFQSKFAVSALIVIFNNTKEVLLFYHSYRKNPWGLPGGYVSSKEHPKIAIKREVKEESGISIKNIKQVTIKLDRDLSRLIICYATKNASGKFKPSNEVEKAQYFKIEKLPKLPKKQKEIIEESRKILF